MSKPRKRLDSAKSRLPAALATLAELRRSIVEGEPDSVQLAIVDQLADELHGLEDSVGCLAPATLFVEP